MPRVLGIDTSNYTTSVALYDSYDGKAYHIRRLLDLKKGEGGIRQSDAVFKHISALPDLLLQLSKDTDITHISCVSASYAPRRQQGSYMPCFIPGVTSAKSISISKGLPIKLFSHQEGHIAAGLYCAGRLDLINYPFICLHLSGGTSELLYVKPSKYCMDISVIDSTLDISAGQLIDRVGIMMGLSFPCGKELDALSLEGSPQTAKTSLKENGFNLSGFENICSKMLSEGMSKHNVSRFVIEAIRLTIDEVLSRLDESMKNMPILFVGGVMSNTILRRHFETYNNAIFASPELSSDNAVGTAVLGSIYEVQNEQ